MAVNFVARKCACGGKLEFVSSEKIWICKYCGTIVEREATFEKVRIDGIEGISDVVRQTLMDIANRKMDCAEKNLEDCERKNHQHVGTLIANLSYHLVNVSAAKTQEEAKASLDKVMFYAKRFNNEFSVISEEEINLYESFGEGASDIYANLLVVFDTLNEKNRVEYISLKIKPEEVFSEHTNISLLKIFIKQCRYELAEAIINNLNHIDKKASLQEIMEHFPDSEKKIQLIEKLFDFKTAEALSQTYFEEYFGNSRDSIITKIAVIKLLSLTSGFSGAVTIVKALYPQMLESGKSKDVFLTLYNKKVSDQETEDLLTFCLMVNKSYEILTDFFEALSEQNVFVVLNPKLLVSFLDSSELGLDRKLDVLNRLLEFNIDGKSLDIICDYYLNDNQDDPETRMGIINVLLKEGCPVSAETIMTYVVETKYDNEKKIDVVKRIFATGVNITYVGNLLSEYLLQNKDALSVREKILTYLMDIGFRATSNDLTQYIEKADDAPYTKFKIIKKLISSGTQVKGDCLDHYILSLKTSTDFLEEIFEILINYCYRIEFRSYSKYLLFCRDINKVNHNVRILQKITGDLNIQSVNIIHRGNKIICNLLQGYVLVSEENYEIVKAVVNTLIELKLKFNTEIIVNGVAVKFKKYVSDHKTELSPRTFQMCEENKMFSLL